MGGLQKQGHGGRLFSGRAESGLVRRCLFDLFLEYRLRALGGAGGLGLHRRRGDGPLRVARVVPADAGMGFRALLCPEHGLHHARVPRKAIFAHRPVAAVADFAGGLRCHEVRGRDFCRRSRVPGTFAGSASQLGLCASRRLRGRLDRRRGGDRIIYGDWRPAGRRLYRHVSDDHFHHRFGPGHRLWADRAGWLARVAPPLRQRHVQPLEAAGAARRRSHLGPGDRKGGRRPRPPRGVVLQRPLSLAGHALLRRSSACGTGVPISTSFNGRWLRRTNRSPGAARSPPRL